MTINSSSSNAENSSEMLNFLKKIIPWPENYSNDVISALEWILSNSSKKKEKPSVSFAIKVFEDPNLLDVFHNFSPSLRLQVYERILEEDITRMSEISPSDKAFWCNYTLVRLMKKFMWKGIYDFNDFITNVTSYPHWIPFEARLREVSWVINQLESFDIWQLKNLNPSFYNYLLGFWIIAWWMEKSINKTYIKRVAKYIIEANSYDIDAVNAVNSSLASRPIFADFSWNVDPIFMMVYVEAIINEYQILLEEADFKDVNPENQTEEISKESKNEKKELENELISASKESWYDFNEWNFYVWPAGCSYLYEWQKFEIDSDSLESLSPETINDYFHFCKVLQDAKIYSFYKKYEWEFNTVAKNKGIDLDLQSWITYKDDKILWFLNFILKSVWEVWSFKDNDWVEEKKDPKETISGAVNSFLSLWEADEFKGVKIETSKTMHSIEVYYRKIGLIDGSIPRLNISLLSKIG